MRGNCLGVGRWALGVGNRARSRSLGRWVVGSLGFGLIIGPTLPAQAQSIAIQADRVITVSGGVIRNGTVVVRNGKIESVGAGISAPAGAKVIKAAVVMPGLVDAHSYLGCQNETDEPIDAVTPDIRACDAFDRESPFLRQAVQAGVTTACLAPGNGNVVGGQTAIVRLGATPTLLNGYAAQKLSISLDATNPQRNPTSRAGVAALTRAALVGARDGRPVSSTSQSSLLVGEFPTSLSERVGALKPVCAGHVAVMVHAPTAADVEQALDIASDFKLKCVLLHANEAYKVADALRGRNIPVVIGPLRFADKDVVLSNAGKLANAGIKLAFCTDAPQCDPASLRMTARLAVKFGLSPDAAVRALTLGGAEALGIAGRTGSIQAGKDADLLVLSGDPLDLTSRVQAVISGGRVVYEAAK